MRRTRGWCTARFCPSARSTGARRTTRRSWCCKRRSTAASSRSTRSNTATRRSPTTRMQPIAAGPCRTRARSWARRATCCSPRTQGSSREYRPRPTAAGRASRPCTSIRCFRPETDMPRILETRRLTPVTKLFRLDAPLIAASARPGQFVMLRVREGGERIPITIADYDRAAGTLTIVVQEVGATTHRVCALEAGEEILDVAGPLGGHIEIPPGGHVCGVGGGFGSASLLCLVGEVSVPRRRAPAHRRGGP